MNRTIVISILLLFLGISVQAQDQWLHWAHFPTIENVVFSDDITADKEGNVYHCGYFKDSVWIADQQRMVYAGYTPDMFIQKLNSDGKPQWIRVLAKQNNVFSQNEILHMGSLPSGNVVVMGSSGSGVDFDPGPGEDVFTSNRAFVFITCFSPEGEVVWRRTFNGSDAVNLGKGKVGKNGDIICVGSFSRSLFVQYDTGMHTIPWNNSPQQFFVTLSESGSFKVSGSLTSNSSFWIHDATLGMDGDIYLTGRYHNFMDCDPGPEVVTITTTTSAYNAFLIRLDKRGNYRWSGQVSGSSSQYGTGVTVDGDGNSYWSGNFLRTTDLDPSEQGQDNVGNSNFEQGYVIKLDSFDNYEWGRELVCNFGTSFSQIATGTDDYVYLAGSFRGTMVTRQLKTLKMLSFRNEAPTVNQFVMKLDKQGDPWMVKQFESFIPNTIRGMSVDKKNNIYVAGSFSVSYDLDGYTIANTSDDRIEEPLVVKFNSCPSPNEKTRTLCHEFYNSQGADIFTEQEFVIERFVTGEQCDSFVRVNQVSSPFSRDNQPLAYPNPNTGSFQVKNFISGSTLSIYNSLGQMVLREEVDFAPHSISEGLQSGVYYIIIDSECGLFTEKVVVRNTK